MWRDHNTYTDFLYGCFSYFIRSGDAVSQLVNVVLFFGKNPNESISGRSYRLREQWFWGKMMLTIDWLFSPLQRQHCKKAYVNDLRRAKKILGI
tara:strand:- start:900 stop:1181 length:282 start_codon:yes stop_codon:yes gene_type:complete